MKEIIFFKNTSIQQICAILTFQYLTKAIFSSLQTIKVTFLILHHFPHCSSPVVSPCCNTLVVSRLPSECNESAGWRYESGFRQRARARWWKGGEAGPRKFGSRVPDLPWGKRIHRKKFIPVSSKTFSGSFQRYWNENLFYKFDFKAIKIKIN